MISFRMTRDITGTGCGSVLQMDELSPRMKVFSVTGSGIRERDERMYHEN